MLTTITFSMGLFSVSLLGWEVKQATQRRIIANAIEKGVPLTLDTIKHFAVKVPTLPKITCENICKSIPDFDPPTKGNWKTEFLFANGSKLGKVRPLESGDLVMEYISGTPAGTWDKRVILGVDGLGMVRCMGLGGAREYARLVRPANISLSLLGCLGLYLAFGFWYEDKRAKIMWSHLDEA